MFTRGLILSEVDYYLLWDFFTEMLEGRIEELDEDEKDELLKSRKKFFDWLKEEVIDLFKFVLDEHNAEVMMVYLKEEWRYVPTGDEFFYLSYREGVIESVISELKIK
jgi:hypothetical protein